MKNGYKIGREEERGRERQRKDVMNIRKRNEKKRKEKV